MKPNIKNPQLDEDIRRKSRYLIVFVFVLLSVLTLRLFVMQIIHGSYYDELSRNNRIRIIPVPAPRGKIFDRDGVVLADNRPAFNVMALPEDIPDSRDISMRLAPLLDKPASEVEQAILKGKARPYDPLAVARDITFDQVAKVEMELFHIPGITIEVIPQREYLFTDLGCHIIGFIGEISRGQLEQKEAQGYVPGDLIGKSGIEMVSESMLKGTKGKRVFEVDAQGQRMRVLNEMEPVQGSDVQLTVDQDLQVIARQSLGNRAGAVVAMVPQTGEILVMESTPGFNPGIFTGSLTPEQWKGISGDPLHPLENRAMRGAYPPGSVFKVVVALAALKTGAIDPAAKVFCPGFMTIGGMTFRCWRREGHGAVDMRDAIVRSCDVYFYALGRALGIDAIAEVGFQLGLGAKTGIVLPDEPPGLMPTREWKRRRFGQPWHPGEHAIAAIGQGYTLTTPLQLAKAMCAALNGGKVYAPRIIATDESVLERDLQIPGRHLDIIRDSLRGVVEDAHGTARALRSKDFTMGGKTGTAQVARGFESRLPDQSDIPYRFRDHAWFFGFSPVEKPEIVVVALVEHGGGGGAMAGPIVRDVIQGYHLAKEAGNEQVRQDN